MTGVMELVAPGDRMRTVGGKLNGSQNGFSILGPVGFPKAFSLLITLRVQPKVSNGVFLKIIIMTIMAVVIRLLGLKYR